MTSNDRHKKRMVVDYSQTINRYTMLDAYPLPNIESMIQRIAQYEVFSTLDLKSAYHQIAIKPCEKIYTAFEANGKLYQFQRIPFGVTNGVSSFQRAIDGLIERENLTDTFAYVDNVTVCGKTPEEHQKNLDRFMIAAKKHRITFNDDKSVFAVHSVRLLGYEISKGVIKPDPERLQPLRDLPPPDNLKAQQRLVGMFAYYAPWINHFSDKIHPLVQNRTFPLPRDVIFCFENLKSELETSAVVTIADNIPLVVETDASDVAIAATLNQDNRPVAFFSRMLNPHERYQSAVEKEACAVVEALRKWSHFLLGCHFRLITDQRSVSFMFDQTHTSKIKNDKIQRWRLELSQFHYEILYRPGTQNRAADTLTRNSCATTETTNNLISLHSSLCHPGVTRMMHFIRCKNLPFSLNDVKTVTSNCRVCTEVKPKFFRPPSVPLIKATHPFERLSMDFKGPLPSTSNNRYLLTITDEYTRFPFAYACKDMSANTIIQCLCQLFSLFGMPSYIHSDRGPAFLPAELQQFLQERGIACSRTTPYNPQGNGQVERLNGTLWKAITLKLNDEKLPVTHWEDVLTEALHSLRSLLCTATNETPHDRMFHHSRKSTQGTSLPTWLLSRGPVLMRKNVRNSKYEPVVEEVELLNCNPTYAHVRLPNGTEQTVSLRHLAPIGSPTERPDSINPSCNSPAIADTDKDSEHFEPTVAVEDQSSVEENSNLQSLINLQQRTRAYNLRSREV